MGRVGYLISRCVAAVVLVPWAGVAPAVVTAAWAQDSKSQDARTQDNKSQDSKTQENKPQDSKAQPLRMGPDEVGEALPVFVDHDPECFNQAHLQIGTMGNVAVAGCDIETKKAQVLTLAGVQITKRHAVMDRNRVVSLAYEFKHHDYPTMRAAFVKAFGPPSGSKMMSEEEGGCAGERVAWKNEVSVVNLQECIAKGGPSLAAFGLLEFVTKTGATEQAPPAQ